MMGLELEEEKGSYSMRTLHPDLRSISRILYFLEGTVPGCQSPQPGCCPCIRPV